MSASTPRSTGPAPFRFVAARPIHPQRPRGASGELCADQRCQVYLGQQREYPAMDRAVAETAGQVLTFEGNLASAVYSANAGGFSASREEGFGPGVVRFEAGFPYLRPARYPTRDRFPWSVTIPLADVAAGPDYQGALSSVEVTRIGPSGRALTVTVDGTLGRRTLPGVEFASALGLRSTLFALRQTTAADFPPARAPSPGPLSSGLDAAIQHTAAASPPAAAAPVSPSPAGGSREPPRDEANGAGRRPPAAEGWHAGWWSRAPLLTRAPGKGRAASARPRHAPRPGGRGPVTP